VRLRQRVVDGDERGDDCARTESFGENAKTIAREQLLGDLALERQKVGPVDDRFARTRVGEDEGHRARVARSNVRRIWLVSLNCSWRSDGATARMY